MLMHKIAYLTVNLTCTQIGCYSGANISIEHRFTRVGTYGECSVADEGNQSHPGWISVVS